MCLLFSVIIKLKGFGVGAKSDSRIKESGLVNFLKKVNNIFQKYKNRN